METRLQLRQRLLRIGDPSAYSATSAPPTISGRREAQANNPDEGEDIDDADGDASEEGEDDDGEDDDGDDCSVDMTDTASTSSVERATSSGAKPSVPSDVIKLLFSAVNPLGRHPTVCFEYPAFLNVSRSYPCNTMDCNNSDSIASAGGVVVTVNSSELPLYFKTHWERNCVKNAFAAAGLVRTKKKWVEWHMAWAKHIPKDHFRLFKGGGELPRRDMQIFNHLPDPWVLGRKDRLLKTLAGYRRRFGAEDYGFFPEGFIIPTDLEAFARAVQRDRTSTSSSTASAWIVKPPASSCGRGIRVIAAKDVDRLCTDLKRECGKLKRKPKQSKNGKSTTPERPQSSSKTRQYVIQRYLDNPLLMDGFKFDLRLYVLVTSVDPLRIYLFQEGITRFCTAKYSLSNTSNRFGHLTNYSVNKKNNAFVENDNALQENIGSKWSLSALLDHLVDQKVLKDADTLRAKIRDVICKTIIAAEAHLTPLHHQFVKKSQNLRCYELFGFDLMLDAQLSPWLIEVNVSPSLMGGSPLDKRVKGLLLSDIFHLVGLQIPVSNLPPSSLPSSLFNGGPGTPSSVETGAGASGGDSSARRRATMTAASSSVSSGRFSASKALHELALDPRVEQFEARHLEWFAPSDWEMLDSMDDEMARVGHFERIFPNAEHPEETAKHSTFFTCQRYANALCAKWTQTPAAVRARRQKLSKSSGESSTVSSSSTRRLNSARSSSRRIEPRATI